MKKMFSVILCVIMVMAIATCAFAFAGKLPIGGGQIAPGGGTEPAEVTNFKTLVDSIGEVTLEDKEAIENAEAALQALKDSLGRIWDMGASKQLQQWTDALTNARTSYDALVAAQNPGDGNIDENGDGTMMVFAILALSMTAMVVLVSRKRAF